MVMEIEQHVHGERTQKLSRRQRASQGSAASELDFSLASNCGKLLLWLLHYPFQRVEDWAVVLAVNATTALRQIKQAEQLGLLERVSPSLGPDTCRLYYLSRAGLLAVAKMLRADPLVLARIWRMDERGLLSLLPRLHALVFLQNMVNALVARAPFALAPAGSGMEVNWHVLRDYQHRFAYHQRASRCIADAALVFHLHPRSAQWPHTEERWYSAFFLLDTGLTGNHDECVVCTRLEMLLRYRESEERTAFHRSFPPVLIVVQDPHQREVWLRSARAAAISLRLDPLVGAIVYCSREADLSSAWPLPWRTLSGFVPCHLEDLLVPMPREAIPNGMLVQHIVPEASTVPVKKGGVLLKGNFTRRAEQLSLEPRQGAAEREVIALLGLRLSRRTMDLLHELYTHPLLSVAELAALFDLQEDSTRHYLYELRRAGCIDVYTTDYGQRLCLSSRGIRLIAATHHMSLQHIAASETDEEDGLLVQRSIRVLLKRLRDEPGAVRHTAGIYGFFAQLYSAAQVQGQRLLWWETGSRVERRYRVNSAWHNLRPDAAMEYAMGERRLRAWLEWDEGTMSMRNLVPKMKAYASYVRTREWATQGIRALPILLIVTPHKGQEQRVMEAARTILAGTGLLVYTSTASRVTGQGPLAPIWAQVVPEPLAGRLRLPDLGQVHQVKDGNR